MLAPLCRLASALASRPTWSCSVAPAVRQRMDLRLLVQPCRSTSSGSMGRTRPCRTHWMLTNTVTCTRPRPDRAPASDWVQHMTHIRVLCKGRVRGAAQTADPRRVLHRDGDRCRGCCRVGTRHTWGCLLLLRFLLVVVVRVCVCVRVCACVCVCVPQWCIEHDQTLCGVRGGDRYSLPHVYALPAVSIRLLAPLPVLTPVHAH